MRKDILRTYEVLIKRTILELRLLKNERGIMYFLTKKEYRNWVCLKQFRNEYNYLRFNLN